MNVLIDRRSGSFTMSGLSFEQMKHISDGLLIKKKYLAARESDRGEDHAIGKAICETTANAVMEAIDKYLETL